VPAANDSATGSGHCTNRTIVRTAQADGRKSDVWYVPVIAGVDTRAVTVTARSRYITSCRRRRARTWSSTSRTSSSSVVLITRDENPGGRLSGRGHARAPTEPRRVSRGRLVRVASSVTE
jgi:hypothetical protein